MTVFGWDASHYDGTLTRAILGRARAEGIGFFTHKIGEGTGYDDPGDLTALAAARDAGLEFIGGYFVPRSTAPVAAQVDACLRLADRDEPWWRSFPGWCWQVDLERWTYDNVPAAVGVEFARQLRARTGRLVVLYASHGQYGDQLAGWDGPLWNADYTARAAGGFAGMYPGDSWRPPHGSWLGGWAAYSGREPTFLQYTSSATIAGLTTCDANAYRGSVEQLRGLIKGGDDVALTDVDAAYLTWRMEALAHLFDLIREGPEKGAPVQLVQAIRRIDTTTAADLAEDKAARVALDGLTKLVTDLATAIAGAGGDADLTWLAQRLDSLNAAVAQVGTDESAAVTALHELVDDLTRRLVAAQQAAAAALAQG